MRDLERLLPEETLEEQYKRTKRETTMSHVQVYGDYNGMKGLKVADFTGDKLSGTPRMSSSSCPTGIVMSQWDVPFVSLLHQLEDSNTTQGKDLSHFYRILTRRYMLFCQQLYFPKLQKCAI